LRSAAIREFAARSGPVTVLRRERAAPQRAPALRGAGLWRARPGFHEAPAAFRRAPAAFRAAPAPRLPAPHSRPHFADFPGRRQ
jgi:hypothetical protein